MIASTQIDQARQVDLLRLLEPDTTLRRIAQTRGGEYAGPCPFCGGADRLHVVPAAGRWYCRQCTPRGGDAIDYVQRRERIAFRAAVELLAGNAVPAASLQPRVSASKREATSPLWTQPGWQRAAQMLVRAAETRLAAVGPGAAARTYLTGRGLRPETWQAWRLGCCQAWHLARREALPAITLPWYSAAGALQAVQYRFFGAELARRDRFGQKAGGERMVFGRQRLSGRAALLITEGELNAISCWQVAGAGADVLSIGPQGNARQAAVFERLKGVVQPYRHVFAWLDEHELAQGLIERIAPLNGTAIWSENGLDANDLLQRGRLAARLAHTMAEAGWRS